jgi:hypothetical protein
MTVVPLESDSIFPLSTEKFSVNGTFKCNIINFTDIQEFRVGSAGIVDMVPVLRTNPQFFCTITKVDSPWFEIPIDKNI